MVQVWEDFDPEEPGGEKRAKKRQKIVRSVVAEIKLWNNRSGTILKMATRSTSASVNT